MSPDGTPWVFKEWAIVACRFEAPEVKRCSVRGKINGRLVTSAGIDKKLEPLTYSTVDGQVIRLEGPPEPAYAAYCKQSGIQLDVTDPIKFRQTAEDFEWAIGEQSVQTGLPQTRCPKCGVVLDAAISPGRVLRPGDGAVCVDCGSLLIFVAGMGVRLASDAEEANLGPADKYRLREMRKTVAAYNAYRSGVSVGAKDRRGPHAS